jgi:hypothetical protein
MKGINAMMKCVAAHKLKKSAAAAVGMASLFPFLRG